MEESVVFALIVMERASECVFFVFVCVGGGVLHPLKLAGSP
jgi:hypothetical protein